MDRGTFQILIAMHLPEPFGLTEEAFTTPTSLLGGHTLLDVTFLAGAVALVYAGARFGLKKLGVIDE